MHVMFIHPNFPGHFALAAHYLATQVKWQCSFVTSVDTKHLDLPFLHINYRLIDDAPQPKTFTIPDSLQGLLEHAAAIYRGLRGLPQLQPNLVVGHMSYGTMLYLRDLYPCPFVGYFELLPAKFWGDGLQLRKEFPPPDAVRLANATFHSLTHLHLHACDACYTSSQFQLSMCPPEYRHKLTVLPDGIDCAVFQPRPRPKEFRGKRIDPRTPVVTYVSRGLESARGFDIFMKFADKLGKVRPDVIFFVVGAERTSYGHELFYTNGKSFKEWVLSQGSYDLNRIHFLGQPPLEELAALYNLTNLHVHLSAPYLPSPSLLQAMASGCPILGSATAPVQEFIDDGTEGALVAFDDVEAMTARAIDLLDHPEQARVLGQGARQRAVERYEIHGCLQRFAEYLAGFQPPMDAMDLAFSSMGPE